MLLPVSVLLSHSSQHPHFCSLLRCLAAFILAQYAILYLSHRRTFNGSQNIKKVELAITELVKTVPVAARSKAWVCGRYPAEIAGLNPTGVMDVCLL